MFTFTTRRLLMSRRSALSAWSKFEKEVGRLHPGKKFHYVAVVEAHSDGMLDGDHHFHLHVAVAGYWDVRRLLLIWHRVLTGRRLRRYLVGEESPGNIDVPSTRKGHVRPWRVYEVARYLSKYLGKTFTALDERGRRFTCSEGIARPRISVARVAVALGLDHVQRVRRHLDQGGYFGTGPPFEFVIAGRRCWLLSGDLIPGRLRDGVQG
jgi:hypothetical protein